MLKSLFKLTRTLCKSTIHFIMKHKKISKTKKKSFSKLTCPHKHNRLFFEVCFFHTACTDVFGQEKRHSWQARIKANRKMAGVHTDSHRFTGLGGTCASTDTCICTAWSADKVIPLWPHGDNLLFRPPHLFFFDTSALKTSKAVHALPGRSSHHALFFWVDAWVCLPRGTKDPNRHRVKCGCVIVCRDGITLSTSADLACSEAGRVTTASLKQTRKRMS